MCGIAGYTDFSGDTNPQELKKMMDSIYHRGPDSSGKFISVKKLTALGIRRLSIIDLVTGDQPIKNEDGTIVTVFNGEIYNYKYLRKKLIKKGHKFITESDTETIVHLYEEYGQSMVGMLNGMFAFAIWDENKKRLFLARDRAGIKPLYYYYKGDRLIFASEIKAILKNSFYKSKINENAIKLYLYFGYVPSDKTFFEGISKLLPGYTLSFSKKQEPKVSKYFELFSNDKKVSGDLDNLLNRSVKSQLQADVPVGVFLSGGLDSSLVSYYITKAKSNMKSFSIVFEEESFDESRYAKMVSKRLGTKHYQETLKVEEIPDLYQNIVRKLDEPLADASLIPTYKVSELAKKHVKVVLSGDGGDELFGGYPTYQAQLMAGYMKFLPEFIFKAGSSILGLLPESDENYPKKNLAKIVARAIKKEPVSRQIFMMRTFFLGDEELTKPPNLDVVKKILPEMKNIKSDALKAQVVDFCTYMRDDFLVKTDRASMFNSLEVRVPFLDNDLMDFAFDEDRKHVDLFKTKKLLRDLAEEKIGIDAITKRPKKGFGIPVAKWLKSGLKDFGKESLENKKLYDYLEKKKIKELWEDHQKGNKNNGGALWMLIMFSGWLNNWT